MDYIRKELDHLLGKDRDVPLKEKQRSRKHFDDRDVCSFFLIEFCPHELFPNTKNDLGECKKRHDNYLRDQFNKDKNSKQYRLRYEEILESFLERLIGDVDTRIKKGIERIEAPLFDIEKSREINAKITYIDEKIQEYLIEAERYGEQGLIKQSEDVMKQIESLKEEKSQLVAMAESSALSKEKQMKICEVCGALQSAQDNDKRLQTHYEGRIHTGYAKIREVLDALKRKKAERKERNEEERERERHYQEKMERENYMRLKEIERNHENKDLGNYFDQSAFEKQFNELKDGFKRPIGGGHGRPRDNNKDNPNNNFQGNSNSNSNNFNNSFKKYDKQDRYNKGCSMDRKRENQGNGESKDYNNQNRFNNNASGNNQSRGFEQAFRDSTFENIANANNSNNNQIERVVKRNFNNDNKDPFRERNKEYDKFRDRDREIGENREYREKRSMKDMMMNSNSNYNEKEQRYNQRDRSRSRKNSNDAERNKSKRYH